jgi:hypothetical protein
MPERRAGEEMRNWPNDPNPVQSSPVRRSECAMYVLPLGAGTAYMRVTLGGNPCRGGCHGVVVRTHCPASAVRYLERSCSGSKCWNGSNGALFSLVCCSKKMAMSACDLKNSLDTRDADRRNKRRCRELVGGSTNSAFQMRLWCIRTSAALMRRS